MRTQVPAKPAKPADAVDETTAIFAKMERPLSTVLKGMLKEFDRFADVVSHHLEPGQGDFQGYDGIENRGEISDLLSSDWALYDLNQTEFLRRIAMREALFRRKNYESASKSRAIHLVIDSGAWMLGHNRLLALGAVFWLSAEAFRRGHDFFWMDTRHGARWQNGLTRSTVEGYLNNVSQHELTQPDLDEIIGHLPSETDTPRDIWLVGSTRAAKGLDLSALKAAFLVDRATASDTGENTVSQVGLWSKGVLRRTLPVAFAEEGLCIGALRRPFAFEGTTATHPGAHLTDQWAAQYWLHAPDGRIYVRLPEGLLILGSFTPTEAEKVWIPLPPGTHIVGISTNRTLLIIYWKSPDGPKNELCKALVQFAAAANVTEVKTQRHPLNGDPADFNFGVTSLPWQGGGQETGSDYLYDRLGREFRVSFRKNELSCLYAQGPVLLARDGRCQVRVTDTDASVEGAEMDTRQEYRNIVLHRSEFVRTVGDMRDVRIAVSDVAVMLSYDGVNYRILGRSQDTDVTLGRGLIPLQLLGPMTGLAYDTATGGIIKFRFQASGTAQLSPKHDKGYKKGLSHLRAAHTGRIAYGLIMGDDRPEKLVRIRFGGKGKGYTTLSITDQIAEARTIWLRD